MTAPTSDRPAERLSAHPAPARDAAALSGAIGSRVTTLRSQRGWSLSALASRAGVGKATLSQIEAGKRNPTLETLYALAAQLQVPLAELLVQPGFPSDLSGPVAGSAVRADLLEVFRDPAVTTEVYRLAILPGQRQRSPGHGRGVTEHLHVLSGSVLAGPLGRAERADAGGHLRWDSSVEHEYAAAGTRAAEAVLVIRTPC